MPDEPLRAPEQPDDPRRFSRRRLLRRAFVGGMALSLPTAVYAGHLGADHLVLREREVPLAAWPRELDGLRVGQITDTHCDCDRALGRVFRAVRMLLDAKPDIVLLNGDYITYKAHIWARHAVAAFQPLATAPLGAYAVLGNHDYWAGPLHWMRDALPAVGIRLLRNEAARIGPGGAAWLVGLDCVCEHRQNVDRALRGVPKSAPRVLLVHEPDYAQDSPPGFAIQFSGHSHGGQARLPLLGWNHTPMYARIYRDGLEQAPHHPVHTSRGVGTVGPQMRFCCDPEVNVVTLRRA